MFLIKSLIFAMLNASRLLMAAALALGIYGAILTTRAARNQPKSRSWLGDVMLVVSIGIELMLLLSLQFFVLGFMTPAGHIITTMINVAPLLALALGIYGAILTTRAAHNQPKSRSWLGDVMVMVAVVIQLALLTLQSIAMVRVP
jgi:hypothetical protein